MRGSTILAALIASLIFVACQPANAECDERIDAETLDIAQLVDCHYVEK